MWMGCLSSGKTLEIYAKRTREDAERRFKRRQKRQKDKSVQLPAERNISDEFELVTTLRTKVKMTAFAFAGITQHASIAVINLLVSSADNAIYLYACNVRIEGVSGGKRAIHSPSIKTCINFPGHRSEPRSLALSSDNKALMSCSADSIKLWDIDDCTVLRSIAMPSKIGCPLCCIFAPGDLHGIIGTRGGKLFVVNLVTAQIMWSILGHNNAAIWSISVSPDEAGIVSGGSDKLVKFWDFEIGRVASDVDASNKEGLKLRHTQTLKLSEDVLCVKFSHVTQGAKLAISLLDCTVKVFFHDSLKLSFSLYGHRLPVLDMDISSDNSLIVTGSIDKNIKVWGNGLWGLSPFLFCA